MLDLRPDRVDRSMIVINELFKQSHQSVNAIRFLDPPDETNVPQDDW